MNRVPFPIENFFPIQELNTVANAESQSGPARKSYRPLFSLHKWWARRLGTVFRTILLTSFDQSKDLPKNTKKWFETHFYSPQNLLNAKGKVPIILDPFMGGGTTLIEALKLHCKVIGVDVNPLAWFIVKKEIEPVDLDRLSQAYARLEEQIAPQIRQYYETTCPSCQKNADIMYVFWVKTIPCPQCQKRIALFRSHIVARPKKNGTNGVALCPSCKKLNPFPSLDTELTCTKCNLKFSPKNTFTLKQGQYFCNYCGTSGNIVELYQRANKQPLDLTKDPVIQDQMYAIEYYCRHCENHSYKDIDKADISKYTQITREYEKKSTSLFIPSQKIPLGDKTKEILNFGYDYFYQLFTPRQIICINLLYNAILQITDVNIQEILLLTLSSTLEYNNKLCMYQDHTYQIENSFSRHAYYMKHAYVENNLWGTKVGTGAFRNRFRVTLEAKQYNLHAYERKFPAKKTHSSKDKASQSGKTAENQTVNGVFASDFDALKENPNCLLLNQDAQSLQIPDKAVDIIITDPPYYDNVQYAELADLFYVWLRFGLAARYSGFKAELTPKNTEIVVNSNRKQTHLDYMHGMTSIFNECSRVLHENGIMIFTFHHQDPSAWEAILDAILSAHFIINAIYPIRSELKINKHVQHKKNSKYDLIFVCQKQQDTSVDHFLWEDHQDDLVHEIELRFAQLNDSKADIQSEEKKIITLGVYLKFYSLYWPEVYSKGNQMSIKQLIQNASDAIKLD